MKCGEPVGIGYVGDRKHCRLLEQYLIKIVLRKEGEMDDNI